MIDETYLLEYLFNKHSRLENERIQHHNNTFWRTSDELDYLENIIMLTRVKEFSSIHREILDVIQVARSII